MPVPISALAPLVRTLMNRAGSTGGSMGPPERGSMRNLLGAPMRGLARADNAVRNFTGGIGDRMSGGVQNLVQALGGMFGRQGETDARGMGPSWGAGGVGPAAPYSQPGNPFAGQYQQPPNPFENPYGNPTPGGNPFAGGYGQGQPVGGRARGFGGNSVGAVGGILSMPFANAGDAIGFMRRN